MIVDNIAPPTRTPQTERAYAKRVRRLLAQAARETDSRTDLSLVGTIAWFCGHDRRWSRSTVRQYKSALCFVVEAIAANGLSDSDKVEVMRAMLQHPPAPKSKGSPRETSARKRKSVRLHEIEAVMTLLSSGTTLDRLAGLFVDCNIRLGLRPTEWRSAKVAGTELTVRCAKHTNGRGITEFRPLYLDPILAERPDFLDALDRLFAELHGAAAAAGSWETLWSRLASRIARACQIQSIRRIALYTTRHVALATAKQTLTPVAVAALAGHVSSRTAQTHYGRCSSGLSAHLTCAVPSTTLLALVREPLRTERLADGRFRREKAPLNLDGIAESPDQSESWSAPIEWSGTNPSA